MPPDNVNAKAIVEQAYHEASKQEGVGGPMADALLTPVSDFVSQMVKQHGEAWTKAFFSFVAGKIPV